MKWIHTLLSCVVLLLHSYLYAQEPTPNLIQEKVAKPKLFERVPDHFECNSEALYQILNADVNEPISLQLSSQFSIKGKIVDKNQDNPGVVSVNIKLENYHSALFNVSIRLQADNSTLIQGRILHPRYSDVLVLYKEKGRYYFKKKSQELVMPE